MLSLTEAPKTEVIRGQSFEDYVKFPGLNQSLLKRYEKEYRGSPRSYWWFSQNTDAYDSDALRAGRAFHCLLLEPGDFSKRYRFMDATESENVFQLAKSDAIAKKSKSQIVKFDSFQSYVNETGAKGFANTGAYQRWLGSDSREVISAKLADSLQQMVAAIGANEDVGEEIRGITLRDCEVTVVAPHRFKDRDETMQLKARLDIISQGDAIIDAKTCRTTNDEEFARDVARYGYDIQAAFYLQCAREAGLDKKRFGFLAVEKTAPFNNCIHWMPDAWVKYGRIRYRKIIGDIAESIRLNRWPFPPSGELMPPSWLESEIEAVA